MLDSSLKQYKRFGRDSRANMFYIFLFSVNLILGCAMIALGQSTTNLSEGLETDELVATKTGEYDQRLTAMYDDLSLKFQRLHSASDNLMRGQMDHHQTSLAIFSNISVRLEGIDKLQIDANKCFVGALKTEQLTQMMSQNLSSESTKNSDKMKKSIANLTMQLDEKLQMMYQNLSSKFDRIEELLKTSDEALVKRLGEIEQRIEFVHQNFTTTSEENMRNILQQIDSKDYCRDKPDVCDCSDIKASGFTTSEVYRVYVIHENRRHYANAFCDMTTANGSWLIFQRRKDGSEDFYRGWDDYSNGFGNPNSEFWLGNEFLHLLTSKRRYRLRVEMQDFEGNRRYAEYSGFSIKSSDNNYTLSVGSFSGDAGDSLTAHSNKQFSTFDHDSSPSCATAYHGAWWYNACHSSNLNGRYFKGNHSSYANGINWYDWRGHHYSLKTTEMKISQLN